MGMKKLIVVAAVSAVGLQGCDEIALPTQEAEPSTVSTHEIASAPELAPSATHLLEVVSTAEPAPTVIAYLQARLHLDFEAVYDLLSEEDQSYITKEDYAKFARERFLGNELEETKPWRRLSASETIYAIDEIVISEAVAHVSISLSTPDFVGAMSKILQELFFQAVSQAFASKQPLDSDALEAALDSRRDIPVKTTTEQLELRLEAGVWTVHENVKFASAAFQVQNELNGLLAEAAAFEAEKSFSEAVSLYNRVLEIDGSNSKAKEGLRDIEEAQVEQKIRELLEKAAASRKKSALSEAANLYQQALEIDSANSEAKAAISEIEQILLTLAYAQSIEIFEFEAKFIDTYSDKQVPAVKFALKNKGDRALKKVRVVVYFYDTDDRAIHEETYTPILVGKYSSETPLKPNYIWRMERKKYYTIDSLGPEWSGRAQAVVTDLEFAE